MTQAFNLSQFANKVNTSGQASLTTAVTGTLPVANGGTGATTLTSGSALIGNGTGAVSLVAAGTAGNVLTSNGTTWTSSAASGGQLQTQVFTAPGTWTKPASCTQVRVTVMGGGGGGRNSAPSQPGGYGGFAKAIVPVSAPVTVTIGAAGPTDASGSTSSFGPAVSATGGAAGTATAGAPGTGTVSVGTAIKTASVQNVNDSLAGGNILVPNASTSPFGTGAITYSTSIIVAAGAAGASGNFPFPARAGVGGAVVVEFLG
jgi:hypothetical protein